ncbi:MAG: hypothetical protein DMG30_20065 [Acidobacteria bacterium]|nr:MAG: hypothetical protein DMG30_20065 [Acidobacteriota bacterium]
MPPVPTITAGEAPQETRLLSDASLLSVKDVARLLGMSTRWVHERTRRREIPCYRFGSVLRFHPVEIREWLVQWRQAPAGFRG